MGVLVWGVGSPSSPLQPQTHPSGESYAGIYVPTLSYAIYESNQGGANPKVNIVGAFVGNGCLGNDVATCSNDPRS